MKKYDWPAADEALWCAIAELYAAQRHRQHGKRERVLTDLRAAEAAIAKVRTALQPAKDQP